MPGRLRFVVLAATKMKGGICVAGVTEAGKWVRPVSLPSLNFPTEALRAQGRVVVEPNNEVEFRAVRHLENHPQSEDVEVDTNEGPHLIRTLPDGDLPRLLRRCDETSLVAPHITNIETFMISQNRSLVLVKVGQVIDAYRSGFNREQRRIHFVTGGQQLDLPCTDLRWRAFTRATETMTSEQRTEAKQRASHVGQTFVDRDHTGLDFLRSARELYFAIGLGRKYLDHCWPLLVGIHSIPSLVQDVDYGNL